MNEKQPPSGERSDRLIEAFEMVVSRLDSLDNRLKEMRHEVDQQRRAQCHVDSLRPLGTPFSGFALCGEPVEMVVHSRFDIDGRLCNKTTDPEVPSCMFVQTHTYLPVSETFRGFMERICSDEWLASCVPALVAKWGPHKCEQILASAPKWNKGGMMPPLYAEIFMIDLLFNNPGLLGCSRRGFFVSCRDIKEAYHIVSRAARYLEIRTDHIEVFTIEKDWVALAMTYMMPNSEAKGRVAWHDLGLLDQIKIMNNQCGFLNKIRFPWMFKEGIIL